MNFDLASDVEPGEGHMNLSPRLVDRLEDGYPGSVHVAGGDLDRALDREIWEYARTQGRAVVTKDADFGEVVRRRVQIARMSAQEELRNPVTFL